MFAGGNVGLLPAFVFLTELEGSLLKLQMKPPHKIADVGVTALTGNGRNGQFTVQKQQPRPLHPALGHILHGADAYRSSKMSRQASGGYMIFVCQVLQ